MKEKTKQKIICLEKREKKTHSDETKINIFSQIIIVKIQRLLKQKPKIIIIKLFIIS